MGPGMSSQGDICCPVEYTDYLSPKESLASWLVAQHRGSWPLHFLSSGNWNNTHNLPSKMSAPHSLPNPTDISSVICDCLS